MRRTPLVLAIALLAPASAHASTVHVAGAAGAYKVGYRSDFDVQRMYYEAAPGERNDVTVSMVLDKSMTVTDPGATIEVGRSCERIDAHSARCYPIPPSPSYNSPYLDLAELRLGDGDD